MTDPFSRAPADEAEAPDAQGSAEAETPDPAAVLAAEAAELKDKLLRALAEMDNQRKRTEREVGDARLYGVSAFARDMLGVADNMRRALAAFGPDLREKSDAGVKALIEGVELTERELLNALEKHGVKRLDPAGQKFDPHFHQAMFELPDDGAAPGTVVQVMQDGYTIGDRVLRPALVGIAKGAPKPVPGDSAGDNTGDEPQ